MTLWVPLERSLQMLGVVVITKVRIGGCSLAPDSEPEGGTPTSSASLCVPRSPWWSLTLGPTQVQSGLPLSSPVVSSLLQHPRPARGQAWAAWELFLVR